MTVSPVRATNGPGKSAPEASARAGPVLRRVALTANSSLNIDEVLERLARLALEAIPGDRCAIFLLDGDGKLVPAMGVGRAPNEAEWERFQRSTPIDLKDEPARWQAFCDGHALHFPDLAASPLVPSEFVETFGARRALVMPLMAQGEPLGLMSIDWSVPGPVCTEEENALIEAIGAYVGLAIRNARLYENVATKARTLERLVDVAAALNSAASLTSVLELVCSAFEELLGTGLCSIDLIDPLAPETIRTVAARGRSSRSCGASEKASRRGTTLQDPSLSVLRKGEPIVYPDLSQRSMPKHLSAAPDTGSAVVFPLSRSERTLGYVLAAFPTAGTPSAETLATGRALAELTATATARANLHQELQWRLQRVEILHRLSDVVAGAADLGPALRKLNEVLPGELGIRLESISLANAPLRNAVGVPAPSDQELEAIRSWRAIMAKSRTSPRPRQAGDHLLVPIIHRKRVLGVLNVSTDPDARGPDDEDLLLAIASGCAEVVYKSGLQRELAVSERRLAVVAERERIARDLHDSVGQLLTGLGMRLVDYAYDTADPYWKKRLEDLRDLAARGSREIREAIQSLLFLQVRREGLSRSLRDLARKFEATTGVEVDFRVSGDVVSLATVAEDALFRVAHEALINAERHSGASSISLLLSYAVDNVIVEVTDDGVGLGSGDPFVDPPQGHFGLQGLRRLLEEVGGELVLWNLVPKGLRVEGRVALKGRTRTARR